MSHDRAVELATVTPERERVKRLPALAPFINQRWLTSAIAGLVVWVGASTAGYFVAMRYEYQPGSMGIGLAHWPAETKLDRSTNMSVLAFIHPRCPCTSATVTELTEALRQANGAQLIAVAFVPRGRESDPNWTECRHIRAIRTEIVGARIYLDSDGEESRRFGAATSGTILVYDRSGKEVFRGGITGSRGVGGDSPGRRRLVQILRGDAVSESATSTPVFGCSLESCSRSDQAGAP